MDIPELFGLLSGNRVSVFACLCEAKGPISSREVAKKAKISTAAARTLLRHMSYAGMLTRVEGTFDSKLGRQPDAFVVKAKIRRWWEVTKRTFGSDGGQVRQQKDDG